MTSSRILSSHLPSSWASLYLLFVSRPLVLLLLLVSRLLLLLMPRFNSASFDLKQPNPILAHCIHLLHQSLKNIQMPICKHAKEDMSLETWSEANASISSFWSLLIRTPVVFANEGARAQWRGVAAPSSADLVHSHWSVFNVPSKSGKCDTILSWEEPVHEPEEIIRHQTARYTFIETSVPEEIICTI